MTLRLIAAVLLLLGALPARAALMDMRVTRINDHLIAFYDGRPAQSAVPPGPQTWADEGANYVGVATYAIVRGDRALVYDAYPSVTQARFVRDWLEHAGVRHFLLVNSHWHLDHVGGNAVYADSERIATRSTRERLVANRAAIEAGTLEGPPAIAQLALPTVMISSDTVVDLGGIRVELRPVEIHSADGLVIWLPQDHILLAGDTLEDTVTFISEPDRMPAHIANLAAMGQWGAQRILPNHGNPAVIAAGGYGPDLISATRAYLVSMLAHAHDADFLTQPIERHAGAALHAGTVSLWWAYRDAHQANLQRVAAAWHDKALPAIP
jgi:glyoxylase-like metal-dependent hydrolase (beta-lactamase superfamily II)